MTVEDHFKEKYKSGDTPWDLGQPDFNLIEVVTGKPIPSCKALDIGCGTGDNSLWLAQNRFQVIGTDTSRIGSIGCRFGFKSIHWSSDVHFSLPSLEC